jgi:hypothetical protein
MKKRFLIFAFGLGVAFTGCSDYGKKIEYGQGELYYTANVTELEARNLGKYLTDVGMFPKGKEVSYQLDKSGGNYIVKMPISDEKYINDAAYLTDIQTVGGLMSKDVFTNQPVDFWLCDDGFNTLKVVPFKALPDSLIKKSDLERLNAPATQPDGGMPKDNVIPVDTSNGQPA